MSQNWEMGSIAHFRFGTLEQLDMRNWSLFVLSLVRNLWTYVPLRGAFTANQMKNVHFSLFWAQTLLYSGSLVRMKMKRIDYFVWKLFDMPWSVIAIALYLIRFLYGDTSYELKTNKQTKNCIRSIYAVQALFFVSFYRPDWDDGTECISYKGHTVISVSNEK